MSNEDCSDVVYVGDTRELIESLPSSFANLIFIDPPYMGVVDASWDNETPVIDDFIVEQLARVLAPTGALYVCCGIGEKSNSYDYFKRLFNKHLVFKDHITLAKDRGIGNRRGLMYAREEMLFYVKDPKNFVWNTDAQYSKERRKRDGKGPMKLGQNGKPRLSEFKRLTNVWTDVSFMTTDVVQRQKYHPTPKPVKLVERVIALHTKRGDTVFDCYAGVMTTWEACRRTGRRSISIEINRDYVELGMAFFNNK